MPYDGCSAGVASSVKLGAALGERAAAEQAGDRPLQLRHRLARAGAVGGARGEGDDRRVLARGDADRGLAGERGDQVLELDPGGARQGAADPLQPGGAARALDERRERVQARERGERGGAGGHVAGERRRGAGAGPRAARCA